MKYVMYLLLTLTLITGCIMEPATGQEDPCSNPTTDFMRGWCS